MLVPHSQSCIAGLLAAFATLCLGCGKGGPDVVQLSGTASFNGKPIPRGMIIFEPNPAKGGRGPQGHAEIRDGRFETNSTGKGVAAGSVILHVTGGDGVNPDAFTPYGSMLFEEYVTVIEVSPEQTNITIDVPTPKKK